MRHLINLVEDQPTQAVEPDLSGTLDINGLMSLLPLVNDQAHFLSAFNKAKAGQGANMDVNEKGQFVRAFISLLGSSQEQRQEIINKMTSLTAQAPQATTGQAQGQDQSAQNGNNG